MPGIDPARLAEIEAALAEPGISGVPLEWVRDLCETLRAAWAERDKLHQCHVAAIEDRQRAERRELDAFREREEAVALAKGWQDEHCKSEYHVANLRIERDAAREQVRQLREALEALTAFVAGHETQLPAKGRAYLQSARRALEAIQCP